VSQMQIIRLCQPDAILSPEGEHARACTLIYLLSIEPSLTLPLSALRIRFLSSSDPLAICSPLGDYKSDAVPPCSAPSKHLRSFRVPPLGTSVLLSACNGLPIRWNCRCTYTPAIPFQWFSDKKTDVTVPLLYRVQNGLRINGGVKLD
jgi:hypothetical protein